MMIDWEFLRQEVPALSQLEDLTVIHDHGKLLCTQNLPPSARCYAPPVPALARTTVKASCCGTATRQQAPDRFGS